MKKERLRIDHLKKGTLLKRVRFSVYENEILHCVFDNIQEKHLFLKIMEGTETIDGGKVYYEEKEIPEKQVQQLLKSKISVISKESKLIDSVTISENILLMRPEVKPRWVHKRELENEASQLLETFHIAVDLECTVSQLSNLEKVQVEILKEYLLGKKILILTAISNCLSDAEVRRLWELLCLLKARGISVLIIEPLEDLNFNFTDMVAIVKHGKTCIIREIEDCDYTMLHTILYQTEINDQKENWNVRLSNVAADSEVGIRGISSEYLRNVSISVAKGEIVKLFCIDERSYEEIVGVLKGEIPVCSGSLYQKGAEKEIRKWIRGVAEGIGIVEGNPVMASLFQEMSAIDNLQMLLSRKVRGIWAVPKYKKSIKRLLGDIVPEETYACKVKDLPPQEVQKIIYCRWLLYSPELLVCIQPFAEGDIKAREVAREMLYIMEKRKIPILLITSNTAEFNYCRGRELYMHYGRMIDKKVAYQFLHSEL